MGRTLKPCGVRLANAKRPLIATMTPESLVVVRSFSLPHEAHLARSVLEAAGIDAVIADEHIVAADWLYSNAVGGVKVLVRAADADTARSVLDTPAQTPDDVHQPAEVPPETDVTRCARCGAEDIAFESRGRRVAVLSWLLAGIPLFPVRRRLKCGRCGHRFR
jgi:hypothetical protein